MLQQQQQQQQQSEEEELILIIDSEGESLQELAAICLDVVNLCIKDVYLQWAKPSLPKSMDVDWFARKHVHGLNRNFLQQNGFENEEALMADFNAWRRKYTINEIIGHAPAKEEILLNLPITDVKLAPWAERYKELHHCVALCMKTLDMHVKDTACSRFTTHSEYEGWHVTRTRTRGDLAREEFGAHCALYDCVSIMLHKFPNVHLFSL